MRYRRLSVLALAALLIDGDISTQAVTPDRPELLARLLEAPAGNQVGGHVRGARPGIAVPEARAAR